MTRLALYVLVLAACVSVTPTEIPVCSWAYEVVCRAPSKYALHGGRDLEWEHESLCPEKTDLRFRSCYVRAGMRDGHQLYRYVWGGQ